MSARLREIIVEATGTDRADLRDHILLLLWNAQPVRWAKPRSVARQAETLAKKLPKITRALRDFDAVALRHPPHPIEDAEAVREAAACLDRALKVLDRVQEAAEERAAAIMAHAGLEKESARPWRAEMIALAAAFVFDDLSTNEPKRYAGGETRYSRMVSALYDHFRVDVTPAQRDEAIRRALQEFDRCK